MMKNMNIVVDEVKALLDNEATGHGWDHVERVYNLTRMICEQEKANEDIALLAALLHDADDYKLFGEESSCKLLNAHRIMDKCGVDELMQQKVCDIISNMGYSKSLKGIRPQSLEGKIVSDADMLDAIGALGSIRCLVYALAKCQTQGNPIFDEKVFPELNMSAEEYKKEGRKSDNFINHFFEKMLRLKDMMMTTSGRKEAEERHEFMLVFLKAFFREQGLNNWSRYLEEYQNNIAA